MSNEAPESAAPEQLLQVMSQALRASAEKAEENEPHAVADPRVEECFKQTSFG